MAMVSIGLG